MPHAFEAFILLEDGLRGGFVGSGAGSPAYRLTAVVGNVLFRTERGEPRVALVEDGNNPPARRANCCVGVNELLYV